MTPILVESVSFFLPHVSVVIVTVHLLAYLFFNNLPTFVIEHSLVTRLLKTRPSMIIHLLPLNDSIALTNSSSHLVLVPLLDRAPILVEFCLAHKCLLNEMALSTLPPYLVEIHCLMHVVSHLFHHLVHAAESTVSEEGIVLEWVSQTPKRHHYLRKSVKIELLLMSILGMPKLAIMRSAMLSNSSNGDLFISGYSWLPAPPPPV
jgi:hypothetical protein